MPTLIFNGVEFVVFPSSKELTVQCRDISTVASQFPLILRTYDISGYLVAIAWIMAIADETVNLFQVHIFGLSHAIIGLTIFAVGNSLTDLVANMSVAVSVLPLPNLPASDQAVKPGSYVISQTGCEPYTLHFSPMLMSSTFSLLTLLIATLVIVPLNGAVLAGGTLPGPITVGQKGDTFKITVVALPYRLASTYRNGYGICRGSSRSGIAASQQPMQAGLRSTIMGSKRAAELDVATSAYQVNVHRVQNRSGLVFNTLLCREEFVKHPVGLSALMFSFAALVTHTVFQTDHAPGRGHINMTSSDVDLTPLYGNDQEMQDKVRLKEGHGLLHPDVFTEDWLLFLPPTVPTTYGNWQELVHLLGGTYYYHTTKNAFTPMNLRHYLSLHSLEDFIDMLRAAANEDGWPLVVLPMIFMGEERFQYYYVVPNHHVIAWLEVLNGELLFGECIQPSKWRHKRLELEAQYWKHFEFFPHQFQMESSQVRRIWREVVCYIGGKPYTTAATARITEQSTEATTLGQSSAASMFWTLDQMNQIGAHLATIKDLVDNGIIEETGVVFCCTQNIIHPTYMVFSTSDIIHSPDRVGHHQFLNRHNQPEARLIRSHAVRERRRTWKLLVFMGNAAAMILCMPITIDRIKSTSIDGIVNGVEVNSFIDDFSSQAKSQTTLAAVSMAMDIAILAIPGLGTTELSQILCSCSLLLGAGCMFAGTMMQHFGKRMRSMDFASYYLRQKTKTFIVITGIPTSFCVLSVTGSILGFLTGVATDFKPSAPLMIASLVTLGVVVGLLLVLVVASYGSGPARVRPQ
ncbi:hypothetical protein DFH29DRAFT_1005687 [Suillus ampliporus]|nr:hypothetical protein DFH29DRAFT_1005687 [Suillus ampliporus]